MKPKTFLAAIFILACFGFASTPQVFSQEEQTHTVVNGDTLWSISQRYYNNPHLWPALWALNQDRTSNPHRISVGDVLVIYPKQQVEEKIAEVVKPVEKAAVAAPPKTPKSLYSHGQPLDTLFPKYFSYLANPAGLDASGANKIRVKKEILVDAVVGIGPSGEELKGTKKAVVETYSEVYQVGEIIASEEQAHDPTGSGNIQGKILLSTYDDVVVAFSRDMAKLLDSAAQGEPDPYFREYPIYNLAEDLKEPSDPKRKKSLGNMHHYRGTLTVVARVETAKVGASGKYQEYIKKNVADREPVFYIARITNSIEPIYIGDRIFYFKLVEQKD